MSEPDVPELRCVPALLRRNAERLGDRIFLSDGFGALTYHEMLEMARRTAGGLSRLGIGHGDRVAIMLDNRREFLMAWFGLALLGAVEVPVNQQNVGPRLVHVLNHSGSTVLIVQSKYLPQVEEVADRLTALRKVVVLDGEPDSSFEQHPWSRVVGAEPLDDLVPVRLSHSATVMYTSGSTGPAKGAVLSHGHHYMNGYQAVATVGIGADDRLYLATPLHHNMAQGYGVMPALVAGASVHIGEPFNRRTFWADVRHSEATVFPFVGAMLVLIAKNPPSATDTHHGLRVGYGVPIPAELHRTFEQRFGLDLVHCYGSTEATIVTWNTGPEAPPGAAGLPFPAYEVRVVDDEDLPVPVGETGQICIRSSEPWSMFSGYLDDLERTVSVWRNGWFHSGDRGRIDENGRLWFADRLGDVIRSKGESVSAFEIEEVLVAHPEVSLVAAYGVPNDLGDEDIVASVVRVAGSDLTPAGLHAWCVTRMPRYAMPRYVEIVDEFPMTPTGKIEKYKLRRVGVSSRAYDSRAGIATSGSSV